MNPLDPHNINFYLEYHRKGSNSYREKVRFYEEHQQYLALLDFEERIDIELDYALCLFEIGKYHRFLDKVDRLIEIVIVENIYSFNDGNIYNDLLFKKAACQYNTGQYIQAEQILKSLIKIDPDHDIGRLLYGRCKRKIGKKWHLKVNAFVVILLFSSMFTAFLELFVIKPFFQSIEIATMYLKFGFLLVGGLVFLGNEVYLRYQINQEIGYRLEIKKSIDLVSNGMRDVLKRYF